MALVVQARWSRRLFSRTAFVLSVEDKRACRTSASLLCHSALTLSKQNFAFNIRIGNTLKMNID